MAAPLAAQTLTTWDFPVKVTASTTALTKSSGCDGCADAGAHSATQLTGDGYAEFVVPSPTHMFAGLGADLSASTASSTINYAFNLQSAGTWEIRELGTYRKDGTYAAGDRFRVAVESGAVVYRRNGTVVYTSKVAPPFPLVLDATLYSLGASLTQATVAGPSGTSGGDSGGGTGDSGGSGTLSAVGPYQAITDRNIYAKPALPVLGPAGTVIKDPVFHTPIRRITDNLTRPGSVDRSYRAPSSPHQNAWSVNSSYFYVMGSGGVGPIPYAFDPSTGIARRIQPTTTGDGGLVLKFYIEPQFSYVSDAIIYGSYSGTGSTRHTVDQYDFSTGLYTKLMDLDTIVGGLSGTYIGGVASSGGPTERIEAFFGGTSQDHHHYVLVFDRGNPQNRQIIDTWASTINGKPAPITLNFSLHHAMIDRSGRYVMLYATSADQAAPRNAAQEYLWDTQTGAVTEMADATHPYGHDAFGYGDLVNKDCCTSTSWDAGQWQYRKLASPLATRDVITQILSPKETYLSDHTTWNNARPDRLTPVVSSLYRFGNNTTPWRAWDDEIVAIQTDAPGVNATVWRFAHHRSDVSYDGDPSRTAFWYQPLPNVSQDGRFVLFSSNWEKTLGTDPTGDPGAGARQDVFMLALQSAAPAVVPVAIATPAVPAGRVGTPYTLALSATGGSGAYVWSANALPAGLSLDPSTGTIAGTPSAAGTSGVTVRATDASDPANTAAAGISITVNAAPVQLTGATLASGRATVAYTAAVRASGGSGAYAWSIASGTLPAGVTLDAATGTLSGTPSAAGSFTFVLHAADAADTSNCAEAFFTIVVNPSPVFIGSTALPGVRATQAYSAILQASGGTGIYTWSVVGGSLPAGLTLDAATGTISGTASAAGTSAFTLRVTDAADATNTADASLTIVIAAPPVAVTSASLPSLRAGQPYSAVLQSTGGTGAYTWSVLSGALPAGVTLNAATGAIAGTPSTAGTFAFVIRVVDSADASNAADAALAIVISPSAVRVTSAALPGVRATQPYSAALAAGGGTGSYVWSIVSGSLPAGISLDAATGALTGTASTAGTSTFSVRVTDGGDATNTADASFTIVIAAAPVAVTTASLPTVRAGQPYSAALQAAGGNGSFTWTIVSGALPAGITLNAASGAVSGTPLSAGTATFKVRATDSADSTNAADATLALAIGNAPVVVASSPLPSDRVGVPYAAGLTASGGSGSVTWTLTSGALPSGVALNAATGALSGTPSATGMFAFTAAAVDSGDATNRASAAFTVSVGAAPVSITTAALPAGRERVAYAPTVLQGAGGGGAIVWSATGLPGGLLLNASTGAITGTPTLAGTYTVNVNGVDATDAVNAATATYTVTIGAAIKITSPRTLPDATAGTAYSYTATYANAVGTTKWNLQGGALPPGLTLNATTGVISGTCATKGTYWFNARVQDANTSDTLTLSVTVK